MKQRQQAKYERFLYAGNMKYSTRTRVRSCVCVCASKTEFIRCDWITSRNLHVDCKRSALFWECSLLTQVCVCVSMPRRREEGKAKSKTFVRPPNIFRRCAYVHKMWIKNNNNNDGKICLHSSYFPSSIISIFVVFAFVFPHHHQQKRKTKPIYSNQIELSVNWLYSKTFSIHIIAWYIQRGIHFPSNKCDVSRLIRLLLLQPLPQLLSPAVIALIVVVVIFVFIPLINT